MAIKSYVANVGKITGYGSSLWSEGLDVDLKKGDELKSPKSGRVVYAGPRGGFGNQVVIEDASGNQIMLSHLDAINVKVGDQVVRGTKIGLGGNTGSVIPGKGGDGSHLDITIKNKTGYVPTKQIPQLLTPKYDKFYDFVEAGRKKGYSDTQLLETISKNDLNLSNAIKQAKNLYSKSQVSNDRDLVNYLSQRFSNKMPITPSVPDKTQWGGADVSDEALKGTFLQGGQFNNPLVTGAGKYLNSKQGRVNELASSIKIEAQDEELTQTAIKEYQRLKSNPTYSNIFASITVQGGNPIDSIKEQLKRQREDGTLLTLLRQIAEGALPEATKLPGFASKLVSEVEASKKLKTVTGNAVKSVVVKPIEQLGQKVEQGLMSTGKVVARPFEVKQTPSELTAKIIQDRSKYASVKVRNLEKSEEALLRIDLKKGKTVAEKIPAVDSSTSRLAKTQDAFTNADKRVFNREQLTKQFGNEKINNFEEALNDLEKAYRAKQDKQGINIINQLRNKLEQGTVTATDINQLSRRYGMEYSKKSFSSSTGEPLLSYSGTKFEGVRSGLKQSVRDLFPESNLLENTDRLMSNNYTLKAKFESLQSKIMTLESQIKKTNAISRVLGNVVKAGLHIADVVSGKIISRTFKDIITRTIGGAERTDYLTIQKNLNKYINKLDDITSSTGKEFDNKLKRFLVEEIQKSQKARALEKFKADYKPSTQKALPAPKTGSAQTEVKSSKLIQLPKTPLTIRQKAEIERLAGFQKFRESQEISKQKLLQAGNKNMKQGETVRLPEKTESTKVKEISERAKLQQINKIAKKLPEGKSLIKALATGLVSSAGLAYAGAKLSSKKPEVKQTTEKEVKYIKPEITKIENKEQTLKWNGEVKKLKEIDTKTIKPIPEKEKLKKAKILDSYSNTYVNLDKSQIDVANRIKEVATYFGYPEWVPYLQSIAYHESKLGKEMKNTRNSNGSIDNGYFMINNKAFPLVGLDITNDLDKSTIWAIGLVNSGEQYKWVTDKYAKKSKIIKIE